MKPYAMQLFDKIIAGGEAGVVELLRRADPEDTFLDFKEHATRESVYSAAIGNRLERDDLSNLARSLSGFANTQGGVIVWGLRCVGNSPVERALRPGIVNPGAFKNTVRGLIAGASVPPLAGVELEVVPLPSLGDGRGAVLMYVPQREYEPVMAHMGDAAGRYYFRAGDGFQPVTHQMLSAMFGRRQSPNLQWFPTIDHHAPAYSNGRVEIRVLLSLMNVGGGMAFHSYLNVGYFSPGEASEAKFSRLDPRYSISQGLNQFITFVASQGNPLPVRGAATVGDMVLRPSPPFGRPLSFWVGLGAEGALPQHLEYTATVDTLTEVVGKAKERQSYSQLDAWNTLFPGSPTWPAPP